MKLSIAKDNAIIFGLCLGILLLFVSLWLYPELKRRQHLQSELPVAQSRLNEIRQVRDLAATLDGRLQQLTRQQRQQPGATKTVASTQDIITDLHTIATEQQLTVVALKPTIVTDAAQAATQQIAMACTFSGSLDSCRRLLLTAHQRGYLKHLQEVRLQAGDGNIRMTLNFVVTLG